MEEKRNRLLITRISIVFTVILILILSSIQYSIINSVQKKEVEALEQQQKILEKAKRLEELWYEHQIENDTVIYKLVKPYIEALRAKAREIAQSVKNYSIISSEGYQKILDPEWANTGHRWYLKKQHNQGIKVSNQYASTVNCVDVSLNKKTGIDRLFPEDKDPYCAFLAAVIEQLKVSESPIDNFKEYSENVLKIIFEGSTYQEHLNNLRVFRIYCASERGTIIMFPAQNRNFSFDEEGNGELVSTQRPWWHAAWGKKGSNGDVSYYPSTFKENNSNGEGSGLVVSYPDIDRHTDVTLVRTFWYRFKVRGDEYVIGIDLFFNNEAPILISNEEISLSGLPILIHPIFDSLLFSIFLGFLFYLFADKFFKNKIANLIYNLFPVSVSEGVWQIKANRQDSLYINLEEDRNEKEFKVEGVSINEQHSFPGTAIKWERGEEKRTKEGIKYSMRKKIKLSISDEEQVRGIEIWKVANAPNQGTAKDEIIIGFFEAKWKNTINNLEEELEVLPVFWESQDYNEEQQKVIISQLRMHLLRSQDPQINVSLDPIDESYLEEIPGLLLNKVPFIKKAVESSKYLLGRKFNFSNIKNYEEIYALGDVETICSRAFLLGFLGEEATEGMLAEFLSIKIKERCFIENRPDEFISLYNQFSLEDQEAIKKDATFKVIMYDKNQMNKIISSKRDFALIKDAKSNQTQFVLYYFPDKNVDNEGWISWRRVDINYFNQLYKKRIRSIGGEILEARKVIEQFE